MTSFTSKYKSTPTYSFKDRFQVITSTNRKQSLPSPDQYKPIVFNKPRRNIIFGHQKRLFAENQKIHNTNPGPGAYEERSEISDKKSFNKKQLKYETGQRFLELKEVTPSPGQYESISYHLNKSPKYSIPQKHHESPQNKINNKSPTPFTYDPYKSSIQLKTGISIGHSQRMPNILPTKTPGPGSYQNSVKQISISFNNKKRLFSQEERGKNIFCSTISPGPKYNSQKTLRTENSILQGKFSTEKKLKIDKNQTPGPGKYESSLLNKFNSSKSFVVAKTQRFYNKTLESQASEPGPGDFQTNNQNNFKFKSMSVYKFSKEKLPYERKSYEKKLQFLNPEHLKHGPKYSMALSQRDPSRNTLNQLSPGPCVYNPKISLLHEAEKHFTMPQSKRANYQNKNSLGPGDYDVKYQFIERKIKFSKEKRFSYANLSKKYFQNETFEERQQFPNPPRYMNVKSKFQINQKALNKYKK